MKILNPDALAPPRGYNNGILAPPGSALLFVAGQVAWDRDGRIVSPDFTAQFARALTNVLSVVAEAGGRPESIAKLTIFVTDCAEYRAAAREIGTVYRERMGRHFPAMTLVEVKNLLEAGAKVEIEAFAALPEARP